MPDPTQPEPMSEDELKAIEKRHQSRELLSKDLYELQRYRDESDLLAEVRRLRGKVFSLCHQLSAVRAAVTEESKRADRAEAAARELRREVGALRAGAPANDYTERLVASTAWLSTGWNDGTESVRDV